MRYLFFLVSLALISTSNVLAQDSLYYHSLRPATTASTGISGTGANINVVYHKTFWRVNPDSSVKYIKGYVQTNFVVTANNTTTISFDMNDVLTATSVLFRGATLPSSQISRSNNIITLQLGVTLNRGQLDSLTIFYEGIPPAVNGAAQGYQRGTSSTAGNFISTLSQSFEDRDWWPCKADTQDKIDSMDMTISVPWIPASGDTFWAAANGRLVDSTIVGNNRFFTFQTRYPITSYLVALAVAKFNRYYRAPVVIGGTPVPVVYNIFRGKSSYTNILNALDRMNAVLVAFSDRFGEYPFKREKHGYYEGLMGAAGMEHQTFSGMATSALTSTRTLVHELMHQWFGDHVAFGTWNELWMSEGFARYSEALAGELVPSLGLNPAAIRSGFKNSALGNSVSAWIPDANTVNSQTIWNTSYGSAIYERGAMIVSMLRAIAGDQKFYGALQKYIANLGGKSAVSDSLKRYFNEELGQDLTPFFNDYVGGSGNGASAVGGRGYPIYNINWAASGNRLAVEVAGQNQSANANVTYFRGPIVVRATGPLAGQDTTIYIFDWGGGFLSFAGNGLSAPIPTNALFYNLSFTPTALFYDDSARTLTTGTTTQVGVIPIRVIRFDGRKQNNQHQLFLELASTDPIREVQLEASIDGRRFQSLGRMTRSAAVGYHFSFAHAGFVRGVNYYRARVITTAGEEYTNTITLEEAQGSSLSVYPNPARDWAEVRFAGLNQQAVEIRLLNAAGQTILQQRNQTLPVRLDLKSAASGWYQVQLWLDGKLLQQQGVEVVR